MLIVLGSSPGREGWARGASSSIGREHIIVSNFGYELGKIRWVYENTSAERFLFLQDSFRIKSPEFFTLLDEYKGSVAITEDPYFYGCYAGVYERNVLEKIGIPIIETKLEAVTQERNWHEKYVAAAGGVPVLFPEFTDLNASRKEKKYGRINLVLENDFLIKYKGTWSFEQL